MLSIQGIIISLAALHEPFDLVEEAREFQRGSSLHSMISLRSQAAATAIAAAC